MCELDEQHTVQVYNGDIVNGVSSDESQPIAPAVFLEPDATSSPQSPPLYRCLFNGVLLHGQGLRGTPCGRPCHACRGTSGSCQAANPICPYRDPDFLFQAIYQLCEHGVLPARRHPCVELRGELGRKSFFHSRRVWRRRRADTVL